MNRAIADSLASAGLVTRTANPSAICLGVIPGAIGEVREVVQVLQVDAVLGEAEAGAVRALCALVRELRRARQVALLQLEPGELVGGAQLDAEYLRLGRLPVRRGEHRDRVGDLPRPLADQARA